MLAVLLLVLQFKTCLRVKVRSALPLPTGKQAIPLPLGERMCRNSVHGSRASPRTEYGTLRINHLAVRPERVEGRMDNYDTVNNPSTSAST